ncbi:MAG: LPXTG cell wall anchor domain-containing protein [Lactobacillaceae bacterium]|nr:LPXTG cell wall anchor domain-containing protein [Lactobacillaceae bacterium]
MLASILFSFLVSPVVLADDSVVGASNENVTGHVGFVGKYEYPKVTPKQNEPKGQVFQPHSKDNPFYGGVNVKGKEPVLPNTGDRSSLQNFALPLLLMIFGGAILIPKRTHN